MTAPAAPSALGTLHRLPPVPGVRVRVARALIDYVARRVPVEVGLPDGTLLVDAQDRRQPLPPGSPRLELVRPAAFYERMASDPKVGLGEGYLAGDWRAAPGTDLAQALAPFAQQLDSLLPPWLMRLRRLVDRSIPAAHRNSLTGSRRNIAAHYDLSNDLFTAFLDPTLTYSSAWFVDGIPWDEQSLEQAQLNKVAAVLDRLDVRAGTRLLEIGTGWGTLAIEAARRGAVVTSVTLSQQQAELARVRIEERGLSHLVEIRLQDYREVDGRYDAIASVEMIEAVGEDYWPAYFAALDERLAPGGRVVLQSILMSDERLHATKHSFGWIQKYVFPGGLIPSLEAIERVTEQHTRLRVTEVQRFGAHYAETLRRWRATFLANWQQVNDHGFDETFRRMWELYLAYSEAGFRSGYLDVAHVTLTRPSAGA